MTPQQLPQTPTLKCSTTLSSWNICSRSSCRDTRSTPAAQRGTVTGTHGDNTQPFPPFLPTHRAQHHPLLPSGGCWQQVVPHGPGVPHHSGTATSARGRPRTARSPRGARRGCGAASSHTCSISCSTAEERTAGVSAQHPRGKGLGVRRKGRVDSARIKEHQHSSFRDSTTISKDQVLLSTPG